MMFKQILAAIMAIIMAMAVAGCKEKEPEAAGGTRTTSANLTVTDSTSATTTVADSADADVATDAVSENNTTAATTATAGTTAATTQPAETTTAGGTRTTTTTKTPVKATVAATTKPTVAPTTAATKATTTKKPTTTKAPTTTKPARVPNYDDPWAWPCDWKGMEADCKAYIESQGLHWDAALNVDKGSWAGRKLTVWGELWGDENGRWEGGDGIVTVFDCVKLRIQGEHKSFGDTYFKCVFIPDEEYDGHYYVYIVHDSNSWAGSEDYVLHTDYADLAKKAVN